MCFIENTSKSINNDKESKSCSQSKKTIFKKNQDKRKNRIQITWHGQINCNQKTKPKYLKPEPNHYTQISEWFLYLYIENNRSEPELNQEPNICQNI